MTLTRRITATDAREQDDTLTNDETPGHRADRGEPARVCKFCRDLGRVKAQGFRCVLCYPQENDLIGV